MAAPTAPETHSASVTLSAGTVIQFRDSSKEDRIDQPLVMECSEEPVEISKMEIIERKEDWGEDMITALVIRLTVKTGASALIPAELQRPIDDLLRTSKEGDPEKKNTITVAIGRDVRADYYTILDTEKNRRSRFSIDKVRTPRVSVNTEGIALTWKVDATVSPRVAMQIAECVGSDFAKLTIEALQPELFSGGGYDGVTDTGK